MSKKKLNENEINKISAGGNAKGFGYTSLGILALAGGVAALGHNVNEGVKCYKANRKANREVSKVEKALFAFNTITAGLLTAGGVFALSKVGKDKNDSDNKN